MAEADTIISFPQSSDARLRVALRQLDAALDEQRTAIAAFRRELAILSGAVAHLGSSAADLHASLGDAAEETTRARDAAKVLAVTAATMGHMT